MKTFQTIIFILFIASLSWNCKDNSQTAQIDAKVAKVMAIHDEVMPKMENLHDYSKKLGAIKATVTDKTELGHLERQIGQMDEAGELMMDWMRKFEGPAEKDSRSPEEILSYLDGQEKLITKVKNAMISSLEEGMEAFENYQKQKK